MPPPPPDGPETVIRRARESDWEAYRDLRLRALEGDPLAFGSTLARERAFSPEAWRERITRGAETSGSATWLALDPAGRPVGMVVAVVVQDALHLFAMWVDPACRRRGIGRRLLDEALAWARASHPDRPIVLEVNPRQIAAHRLYESRGFRPTGKTGELEHTPGERLIEMSKPAAPGPAPAEGPPSGP